MAGRFHFSSDELWAMPMTRLEFWYRGHVHMHHEEMEARAKALEELTGGGR